MPESKLTATTCWEHLSVLEGTFGIATEATLRLVDTPPAIRTLLAEFAEVNDASHAVSAIIAAGVMPAALEMMDREIIRAVEASVFAAGLPPRCRCRFAYRARRHRSRLG